MTAAQEDALLVLREANGARVDASKRRSRLKPRARVNLRAADSLVALGLAHRHLGRFDPYTTTDKFTLTAEGLAKARRLGPAVLSRMP